MTATSNTHTKALLLSFSPLDKDPRVLRQAAFLRDDYAVTAAGFGAACSAFPKFIGIESEPTSSLFKATQAIKLKLHHFEDYYWSQPHVADAWGKLKKLQFDVIVANDLSSLPLAIRLSRKNKARIVLDVHEYEPRHFEGSWVFDFFFRPFWHYVAKTYAREAHAMSTVCHGISELYRQEYDLRSEVITNAPFLSEIPPSPVDPDSIKIIHHGICNRYRGLDNMIRLMNELDERFSLDLMLVKTDDRSFAELERLAADTPRVSIIPPVQFEEIIPTLNKYDIGLCMFPPNTLTLQFALPNKFFEFIQAKLCTCTWPSLEISKIISSTECGVVADDFDISTMAAAINGLHNEDIQLHKKNAAKAAAEYCAENNQDIMGKLVDNALKHEL